MNLYSGMKEYGSVGYDADDTERVYNIFAWSNNQTFNFVIKTIAGNLTYAVEECVKVSAFDANCSVIAELSLGEKEGRSSLAFLHNSENEYRLRIIKAGDDLTEYNKYSILMQEKSDKPLEMQYNSPIDDIV